MNEEGCFTYGVSIPMGKAVSAEVLLAFAMNGETLTPEHGFSLARGGAGLRRRAQPEMADRDHRPGPPVRQPHAAARLQAAAARRDKGTVNWDQGVTIYGMPVNAAICEPAAYAELAPGSTAVRGYAIATARRIARVDMSADGGRSWTQAVLEQNDDAPWTWTFWRAVLDLFPGEHEFAVRAWDTAGQTQPALPDDTWNFKGYLSAAWHRVRVRVA